MQRPIIKDGIVVNVIEIGDETEIVTKDRHKELMASEDAQYAEHFTSWRGQIRAHQDEIGTAAEKLSMARMTLAAMKTKAEGEKDGTRAVYTLNQILSLEKEIAGQEAAVKQLQERPVPPKPKLVRSKRWFHPEGLEVGPAGGNIGDIWNGQEYVRPVKPALEKAAELAV